MYMDKNVLSNRLSSIAGMVTPGQRICDVGCDHALVAAHLLAEGIIPFAVLLDMNTGPLEKARRHIEGRGLSEKAQLIRSDGLLGLGCGEAETIIITGMGGRLIQRILTDEPEKIRAAKELILGPQSELARLRRFLRLNGFQYIAEEMLQEDGQFYVLIKLRPGAGDADGKEAQAETLEDKYGPLLLKNRHPVLRMYMEQEHAKSMKIMDEIKDNGSYITERQQDKLVEMGVVVKELEKLLQDW